MRTIKLVSICLLFQVLFLGCASRVSYELGEVGNKGRKPASIEVENTSSEAGYFVATRSILQPGSKISDNYGAYGYLLFAKKPSEEEKKRYLKICDAFLRVFVPTSEALAVGIDTNNIMPTFFPVIAKCPKREALKSQFLLDNYDYTYSQIVLSNIKKPGKEGPYLVAFQKPFVPGKVNKGTMLYLNLYDFTDEDIDRAFEVWKDMIANDPNTWKEGFNKTLILEAFRNFLNRYGQEICDIIKEISG